MGTMIHAKLFPSLAADGPQGLSFRTFQLANKIRQTTFVNKKGKRFKSYNLLELAGNVCGEAGELQGFCKKVRRGDMTLAEGRVAIGKEIADTITYCALVANKAGLSLEDIVVQKFNEVSDRVNSLVKL